MSCNNEGDSRNLTSVPCNQCRLHRFMICEKWLNCAVLPHEHRNDLFVSDNEEIRDIGMFIKDDSIIQTLSGKSYGHKSEKASVYAHFYSLKQVSKLFISRDIDDFAYGNFSYRGPLSNGSPAACTQNIFQTKIIVAIYRLVWLSSASWASHHVYRPTGPTWTKQR